MQIGQHLKIKHWTPKILLWSVFYNFLAWIGVGRSQLELNGVPFSNVKTRRFIIGGVGVADCDFNVATAANASEQVIDLGAIIPALARVLDIKTHTETAFIAASRATASRAVSSNVATIVTAAAHGLVTGNSVVVAGMTDATYNGTHTVTVTNATTFTYSLTHADETTTADTAGTVTSAMTLVAEAGNTSSGHEFIGSATIKAANAITCMAADHAFTVAPSASASHVYVAITPGSFWALLTSGKMSVYVTYIEIV